MKLFDLPYQLAYYKAYHMHGENVTIHLWCIPLILFSAIILLAHLPLQFNIIWPLIGIYSIYYIILDTIAGMIATPFLVAFGLIASYLRNKDTSDGLDSSLIIWATLLIHVLSWGAQFYGHFHFEHKSPAVFDNLIQPLVLAPYFVLFEILFHLGFKSELQSDMMKQARIKRSLL